MTLENTIEYARRKAEENYLQGMLCHANPDDGELDNYIKWGREHEQPAYWLEELKEYKKLETESKLIKSPIGIGDVVYTKGKMF